MSTPMEIIESNIEPENPKPSDPDDVVVPDSPSPPPSAAADNNGHVGGSVSLSYSYSSLFAGDKFLVSVEVCLKLTSTARKEDVRVAVERMLEKRSMSYTDGPIPIPGDDPFLVEHVLSINICDTDEWVEKGEILLFWQVRPAVHVYQLSEEGPCEELGGDGQLSSFNEWALPAKEFHGMWDSLIYESGLKQRLLRYAASALLFTDRGVDPFLVSWNRIILLHGPPGTGKTSLCKALAQKLSIRFNARYTQSQLIEVNAHSLFSKWFSESGKLVSNLSFIGTITPFSMFPLNGLIRLDYFEQVAKLFQNIQEMVEEESNLVFVLIDEVESLAAARKAALSGSEPSDSIRVVNALLTQLDKLKSSPNVIIMTTSNITAAIDIAFVDRADIKAYIGPPTLQARYEILRSCFQELLRTGILKNPTGASVKLPSYAALKGKLQSCELLGDQASLTLLKQLLEVAEACEGLSGRSLRKLPFLTHAALTNPYNCDLSRFLSTLINIARRERSEMPD